MRDDSLINKQYTAKDIKSILGIDRNKLFYWIKTYRLLTPEIEEASGTGKTSKYSLKNLLELATIMELLNSGFDIKTTKEIMKAIDNYKNKKKLNIFLIFIEDYIDNEEDPQKFDVNIYADENKYKIEISELVTVLDPFEGMYEAEGMATVHESEIKSGSKGSKYIKMVFSISELFRDVIERAKKY